MFFYMLGASAFSSGLCVQLMGYHKEALIISKTWDYKKQADHFHYNWLARE